MAKNVTLDEFDHALLRQVGIDNQVPARVLAQKVGLSESAVLRRLRRLRREGVIIADISVVHPAALGTPLTIHVLVSLEKEGALLLDSFVRKLRTRPEIRRAWYVTSETDFVLLLQVGDMEAYEGFCKDVFHDDPNVKSFRTIIAMREVAKARY